MLEQVAVALGGTTRRSKRRPCPETTVAFVPPRAATSTTHGSSVKCAMSASGSRAVAMMSTSRTVSRRRRTLPASDTLIAAGCARSSSTASSSVGSATPSSALSGPGSRFSSARLAGRSPRSLARGRRASEAVPIRSRAQPLERRDAELVPDPADRLRPEARNAHELDDLRGDELLVLRQRVHLAVLDDLDDLLLDRLADSLELLRLPFERHLATEVPVSRIRVAARR